MILVAQNCRAGIPSWRKLILFLLLLAPLASPQNITVNDNLAFGSIFPGVPKSISKYMTGEAAEFLVEGTPGAEVSINFALPPYMYTTGDNMQLVFSATDCSFDSSAAPDQEHPLEDNINPRRTIITRLGYTGLRIWLGGTVIPTLNQKPGSYSGLIILTATYTGN